MPNLSVNFAGLHFSNPIVTASGTYGFGQEYAEYLDLNEIGGIAVKGLTLHERPGNPSPRVAETTAGMLNSVGLQNPGVDAFIQYQLPFLQKYNCQILANISGNTVEEYAQMAEKLSDSGVHMIEANVSCPNVKAGGMAFGTSTQGVAEVTKAIKAKTNLPVMVKLSPNVTDIGQMAKAAEDAGADAICLINTLLGMRIDIHSRRPVLKNNMGGLSGPAIFPVALRMVYQVAKAVNIPILGMGGVMTGEDAAEMLLAGASLVGVGTACFNKPQAPITIKQELSQILETQGLSCVTELIGKVETW